MTTFPTRPDDKDASAVKFVLSDSKDLMPLPVIAAAKEPSYSSSLNEDSEISPSAMGRKMDLASATEVSVDILPEQS